MKMCPRCKKLLSFSSFRKRKDRRVVGSQSGKPKTLCRECENKQALIYIRKSKYNLTQEQFIKLYEKQNGLCAICLCPETTLDRNKQNIMKLSVDHCHRTNEIRGLLCSRCNHAIGLLKGK